MEPKHISIEYEDEKHGSPPEYRTSSFQTLVEVLKCELARPPKSSTLDNGLQPTKEWTPLYYAIFHDRRAALVHFLRAGQSPDGSTNAQPPLCIAVAAGHINAVKILCEAGANVNAPCTHSGETSLHIAVKSKRSDVLDILLRHRPNLHARTFVSHETPLHCAAAKAGSVDIVVTLLKHGASSEALDNKARSPAEVALQARDFDTAITIVRATGAKSQRFAKEKRLILEEVLEPHTRSLLSNDLVAQALELVNPPDSTALVEAIKLRDASLVSLVLDRGANPNEVTASGLYPIFAAFSACSASIVQALVEHGADVTLRNPHGPNVLQAALASPLARDKKSITKVFDLLLSSGVDARPTYSDGATLLHHVVRPGVDFMEIAQHLLQRGGVNVNAQDRNGNTALHFAASSPSGVAMLLKHGANPNIINSRGLTPLLFVMVSATSDNEPDLQILLKASNMRTHDSTGKSTLHVAAQSGLKNSVRLLLEARADSTSTDLKKRTPLLLAILNQQWAVVPLLAAQPGINSWDANGLTALHHIVMSTPKHPSTWDHIAAAAVPFCEKGVSRSLRDQLGSTPLILATKSLPEDGLPVVEVLLSQKGSERSNCVAHEDHEERNALYYAATLGKATFVEALLRHGTPFSFSEWKPKKGHIKPNSAVNKRILKVIAEHEWLRRMAKLHRQSITSSGETLLPNILPIRDLNDMLSMGLDPNNLPRSNSGSSILWLLLGQIPLYQASGPDYLNDALKLVFSFRADANAMSSRKPSRTPKTRITQQPSFLVHPLTHVIEQSSPSGLDLIKILLDNNADPSIPSPLYDGRHPLHSAVRLNRIDIVEEMLHRNFDVNCVDTKQQTPLFIASKNASIQIVDLLLGSKAKVDIPNSEGSTPLHVAAATGNAQIISSLLRAGANADARNHKGLMPLRCIPEKLPEKDMSMIANMLERAHNIRHHQISNAPAKISNPTKVKKLEAEEPTVDEERNVLMKTTKPSVQPVNTADEVKPPQIPEKIVAPSTTTKSTPKPSVISGKETPSPLHISQQTLSIHYTPSTPGFFQPIQNVQPPNNLSKPSEITTKAPITYRIDSGLDLAKASKAGPLPVLERTRASFDPPGSLSTKDDELNSWLRVSKMLDRL